MMLTKYNRFISNNLTLVNGLRKHSTRNKNDNNKYDKEELEKREAIRKDI